MFCSLSYRVDKRSLRSYAEKNSSLFRHHKTAGSENKNWFKLFEVGDSVDQIIQDLRLADLDVRPRYSKNLAGTGLSTHIDHDRIVGINFNLMDEPATIHLRGKPFEYESAVIDVGTTPHSVAPLKTERLVLKLAIRAPWATVIDRVSPWIVSVDTTYVSVLRSIERHLVKI